MDYDQQIQLAQQRQRDAMSRTQFQAPQGRMVSGIYVAPNPLEYLSAALRSAGAGRESMMAQQEAQQASDAKQKAMAEVLRGFNEAAMGKPAQPEVMGNNPSAYTPAQAAQAPDLAGAFQSLLQAPDAGLRQMGMQGIVSQAAPKPRKMERVELPTPDGGRRVGFVDMNAPNPLETFVEAGTENAALQVGPGGQAYNPRALQPGQVLADPNKPFQIGPDGKPVANAAFQSYETTKAAQSAPRVTVNNAGPKAFETELGKLDAKQLDDWRNKAEQAQSSLSTAQKLREAEAKGAFSGGLADSKLAVSSLINGITGVTPKGLVGSELYNAEASKLVLDHIKGLGANPSNADREFIEKTVPRLATSKEARQAMVDFIERSARRTVQIYEDMDAYARKNSGLGGFKIPSQQTPAELPSGFRVVR